MQNDRGFATDNDLTTNQDLLNFYKNATPNCNQTRWTFSRIEVYLLKLQLLPAREPGVIH